MAAQQTVGLLPERRARPGVLLILIILVVLGRL
jgi:hypothetical protein